MSKEVFDGIRVTNKANPLKIFDLVTAERIKRDHLSILNGQYII